jgi:hypothetical protein
MKASSKDHLHRVKANWRTKTSGTGPYGTPSILCLLLSLDFFIKKKKSKKNHKSLYSLL